MKRTVTFKRRGEVYYYKYANEATYHSTGQTSRARAEAWTEGHTPKGSGITVKEYLQPYYVWGSCPLVAHRLRFGPSMGQTHADAQRSRLDRYVFNSSLADKPLHDLRRRDILDWIGEVEEEHGPGCANKALGALKACLRHAVYREDMEKDVCFGISTLKNVEYRVRGVLTPAELQRMFFGQPWWRHERERIALMLGAFAGLRRGELLVLKWSDVHFTDGYLTVERAWKNWARKEIGPPKWGKPRVVPMEEHLSWALQKYRTQTQAPADDDTVVSWDDGSYISPRSIGWWMDAALRAMGIDKTERNLTPHSLRHTFVTFLEKSGMRELAIQAIAGHTDAKTTRLYKHLDTESLVDAMRTVSLVSSAQTG